jgi:hypothetical protein
MCQGVSLGFSFISLPDFIACLADLLYWRWAIFLNLRIFLRQNLLPVSFFTFCIFETIAISVMLRKIWKRNCLPGQPMRAIAQKLDISIGDEGMAYDIDAIESSYAFREAALAPRLQFGLSLGRQLGKLRQD